ncbi:GNAT family N-acetyltransferase [Ideonella oryzae]|uniref:GNAT family N-acetyltransferase n=1 Tax=Ideonella oryzae TaxID=2937441 RepID=A0ABT1BMV5_9BURK|nr:GNAT family N-acetyltransferase [Ideonella oryzae]MCO5977535.1 GNAT family N-acetyltransferase [Ideonella oryzae]
MSATDRLIGTDEPAAWRAALEGVPHSFYASWDCCHAVARNTGRPTWLYVGERASVRVVCPFSVRVHAGAVDWVTPTGFSGFASNGPWPGFASHWAAFARAQGAVCGYIAQHPAFGHPSLEGAVAGEETLYFLDLQGGLEGVLAHAGTDRRRDWRRWQEQGHRFVTDRTALTDFLQSQHRPFLDRMGAGRAAYWNEAALAALLAAPGAGLLGTAEPDGRLVAATLYGWTPWGAEGMIQAALPEGRAHTAALMLGGIQDLAGRGVPWLNLGGGVRPGDNVAAAKMRWRPRAQAFRRLKQVYDPERYAALCAVAGVSAAFTEGYFPAYYAGPAAGAVANQSASQASSPAGSIR